MSPFIAILVVPGCVLAYFLIGAAVSLLCWYIDYLFSDGKWENVGSTVFVLSLFWPLALTVLLPCVVAYHLITKWIKKND